MNVFLAPPPSATHPVDVLRPDLPLQHQELIPDTNEVRGGYRLRFARTEADLDAICKLRYEVFNLELGEGLAASHLTGRDEDRFDRQCQHLMVLHEASGCVVGTYRLQLGRVALQGEGFYSATEFDLSGLPASVLTDSIELGRACIAREWRGLKVLQLLWRGLNQYMTWNGKRYFFGCSSLTSQEPLEGLAALRVLEERGRLHPEYLVHPLPGFVCDAPISGELPPIKIPTLFDAYLRYGAWVLGPPAIDREFGTIDFLTFMDVNEMSDVVRARF